MIVSAMLVCWRPPPSIGGVASRHVVVRPGKHLMATRISVLIAAVLAVALLAAKPACRAEANCAPSADASGDLTMEQSGTHPLGPTDGTDLPATDLNRVRPGVLAPDFTLEDQNERPVTLSAFRGHRPVVLVFYRGHW